MKTASLIVAVIAVAPWATGCFESTNYAPAPLQGGETMTFVVMRSLENNEGTLTFEKEGTGYTIRTDWASFAPQRVGPDLHDGRRRVEAFELGMLWLPPSLREVGAQTLVGTVTAQKQINKRNTYAVHERNSKMKRYYDMKTGFIVHIVKNEGPYSASLKRSTIPGL